LISHEPKNFSLIFKPWVWVTNIITKWARETPKIIIFTIWGRYLKILLNLFSVFLWKKTGKESKEIPNGIENFKMKFGTINITIHKERKEKIIKGVLAFLKNKKGNKKAAKNIVTNRRK
jgi:hypothetical protein